MTKIATFLAVALFAAGLTSTASAAGPMTYLPVTSAKAANALKVGTPVAFTCDKCHGVTVTTVDSSHSHLTGFKCPLCKQAFVPNTSGRGFTYIDNAGHSAHIAVAR